MSAPWAIAAFLVAGGALVVVLAYHALAARQAARASLERTRAHLAAVAAWEFARHAGADIVHSARMTLWPVITAPAANALGTSAAPLGPREAAAATIAMKCACPPPLAIRTTFRLDVTDGSLRTAGQPLMSSRAAAIRDRLLATLDTQRFELVRKDEVLRRPIGTPIGETRVAILPSFVGPDTTVGLIAWMALRDSTGRVRAFFGADAAPDAVTPIVARTFRLTPLLPAAITRGADTTPPADVPRAVVTLRLGDPSRGMVLFDTARDTDPRTVSVAGLRPSEIRSDTVETIAGGFVVSAGLDPHVALRLASADVSSVPTLAVLITLAVALLVAAAAHLRRALGLARQRSEFVASVSHELHTPLALISVYTETLLLGRAAAEERGGFLQVILRETRRLTRIVENLLRVAEADRGSVRVARHALSLTGLVREVVDYVTPFADARGAAVRLSADDDVTVLADRDAVTQILVNVLDNALKFGPTGQTIRVSVRTAASDGVRVLIDDEGPGVPAHLRSRAFQRFARLPGTAAGDAQPGHGIGLSVVRDLAAEHGLTVAFADPPPGVGARVAIAFPQDPPSPAIDPSALPADERPQHHRDAKRGDATVGYASESL